MPAAERVDVAIVGGGVVGAALAYFLAQRGAKPLVIEGTAVAHGASGTAAGLLSPIAPAELEATLRPMIVRSLTLHAGLAELLDGPRTYDYAPYETCVVATGPDDAAQLQARADAAGGAWLNADLVSERCGWIDRPIAGGLFLRSAQLDPAKLTERLLEVAKELGASVRMGRAASLIGSEDRVTGVELEDGVVSADATVIAMGPWVHRAAAWLDFPVPVRPLKGQILHLQLPSEPPPGGFSDLAGQYAVTRPSGLVFAGTTEEEEGFDVAPTEAARERILAGVGRYTSRLASATVVAQTACLRPLSSDGLPIVGAVPGRQGAYLATGHGRKGILLSLATGEALAELIATGRETSLDLTPFRPGRFAG